MLQGKEYDGQGERNYPQFERSRLEQLLQCWEVEVEVPIEPSTNLHTSDN